MALLSFLKPEKRQEGINDTNSNAHNEESTRVGIQDTCFSMTEIENEFSTLT